MKKIWARIGMSLEVTDEEYEELVKASVRYGNYDDVDSSEFPDGLMEKFRSEGVIDGNAYIPACVLYEEKPTHDRPYACSTCKYIEFSDTCRECTNLDHWEPIC